MFSEFHGVPHQVGDDLTESSRVADNGLRDVILYLEFKPDALLASPDAQHLDHFQDNGEGIESFLFHFEITRFHLREIQNVVNEIQ